MGRNEKAFLLLCLLAAIVLFLSSEVAARIVAEFPTDKQNDDKVTSETKGINNNDAKFFGGFGVVGGFEGYPRNGGGIGDGGRGFGGYPRNGGGIGDGGRGFGWYPRNGGYDGYRGAGGNGGGYHGYYGGGNSGGGGYGGGYGSGHYGDYPGIGP